MKYTWRKTPQPWAIRETQEYYARMAAKGWMLDERGTRWDRYVRSEPQTLQFWLEFTQSAKGRSAFDDPDRIPEEQLQLYEDCGWKLIAESNSVHVFAAPAQDTIPQPYDMGDPQQDAMLQQLQRFYRKDLLVFLISLPLLILLFVASGLAPLQDTLATWWWGMFWVLGFLHSAWHSFYGFQQMRRLRRQLCMGHWPTAHPHRCYRIVKCSLAVLSLLCVLTGLVQTVLSYDRRYPLPEQTDGLCLIPSELFGLERTAVEDSFLAQLDPSQVNAVRIDYAFPFYTLYNAQEIADHDDLNVWQDIYVLHWDALAPSMIQSLLESSTFADAEGYVSVEIEGLDGAWYVPGGMEYIAWKGNRIVYASVHCRQHSERLLPMLEATAALWSTDYS